MAIPETAREKPGKGEVVAVGCGRVRAPDVKAGDVVLFGKHGGVEVKIDGVDYPDGRLYQEKTQPGRFGWVRKG